MKSHHAILALLLTLVSVSCSEIPIVGDEDKQIYYVCNIKYDNYFYDPRGCSYSSGKFDGKNIYNGSASFYFPNSPKVKYVATVSYRETSDKIYKLTVVLRDEVLNIANPRKEGIVVSANETSMLVTFVSAHQRIPKGTVLFFSRSETE